MQLYIIVIIINLSRTPKDEKTAEKTFSRSILFFDPQVLQGRKIQK